MTAVGTVIAGRFRVDQLVGAGGMGVVVAATHLELGHRVAIKFLREDVATVASVVERFLREARSVVQLRTEHVCRVMDVGRTETGAPFIVMELLEGSDLGRVVAKQALPVTIAVEYVLQACIALAEAHAAGVVHRDLKPANLFVTRRPGGGPLIKVLDFGIAKAMTEAGAQLTRSHSMLGSPGYISPEQLQSARDVDVRTDIWALGATLYQLLSARLPFYRANAAEMAVRIVMEPPDALDVDPALRAIVWRCLEKAPAQRYADVAALAADLAPFGGPSGRAIAALVSGLVHGTAPPPVAMAMVSPHAMTAASVVSPHAMTAASLGSPPPTALPARAVDPRAATAQRAPTDVVVSRSRRWWLAAPAAVAAVAAAALLWRKPAPPPAPPVVAEVHVAIDAGVASEPDAAPPAPPPDASVAKPSATRPHTVHAKPPAKVTAAAPRPAAATPPAAPAAGSATAKPTVAGSVADTAREAKASCFESAADTPWNSAMCWCTKKDLAHAQAMYAKLSGFKRTTVRKYCAIRGIDL